MKNFLFSVILLASAAGAEIPRFTGTPEGKLANLLLDLPSDISVISIPAILEKSNHNPFGDKQTNAKMKTDFRVIGLQQQNSRIYKFDPSLKVSQYNEINLGNGWFKVTPSGWKDSFYFNFDTSSLNQMNFLAGIPASLRTFSQGRLAPDPEKIGNQNAYTNLMTKQKGEGYEQKPWLNDSVHSHFPDENGAPTATGGVATWGLVNKSQFGPFKQLYTCFEARNLQKEKELGVPSGAGWHHIGDPAESILNNLERVSIPVAIARSHRADDSAYGMSETITGFWLQPQQVFVASQNVFHWYVNPYQKPVCTEIWVHNCVPGLNNNWGFNCPWN